MSQQFGEEKAKVLEESDALYQAGLGLFQAGDIREAEECFASAVRPFLSKNTMRNIYVKVEDFIPQLLDAMYHMGLIYLEYGRSDSSGIHDHFSSAAGIFQYCHKFHEKHKSQIPEGLSIGRIDFLREAYLAEEKFLSTIGAGIGIREDESDSAAIGSERDSSSDRGSGIDRDRRGDGDSKYRGDDRGSKYYASKIEEYNNYREELSGIRELVGQGLEAIEDMGIDRVGERASSVRTLYDMSSDYFVSSSGGGLVQRLLADCQEKLGPAPCEFAVVGLGSLAAGKMTPWSDLEFAIITKNDDYKDSKNHNPVEQQREKEYFRNLTKLLHIKVINFGETPLRSVGIESFNNFKTGEESDEWFWDDYITSGFSFDGPHSHACKTPLGRQGGASGGYRVKKKVKDKATGVEREVIVTKQDFELIMTPEQLAAFQNEGDTSKLINHRGETVITREELLAAAGHESEGEVEPYMLEGYLDAMDEQRDGWFESDTHLVQGLRSTSLIGGTGRAQYLLDEYRKTVREQDEQIGQNGEGGSGRELVQKRSLKLLAENLDDFELKLGDEEEGKLLDIKKSIYRIADRIITELANYYGIQPKEGEPQITSWEAIDRMASSDNPYNAPLLSREGAQHLREALSIAAELRLATYSHNKGQKEGISTYVPAVEHLTEEERHKLIEETFHIQSTEFLHHFYQIMFRVQKVAKALCERTPVVNRSLSDARVQEEALDASMAFQTDSLLDTSDHTKGLIHARFLEYDKAVECLEKSREEKSDDLNLLETAQILYLKLELPSKAVNIGNAIHNLILRNGLDNSICTNIIAAYNNLGMAYRIKGEYDKALEYHIMAVKTNNNFELKLSHLVIAMYHNNIGNVYEDKGEFDRAIEEYQQALEIYFEEHSEKQNHPDIAMCYNNLGIVHSEQGEYEKAVKMYMNALLIYQKSFELNPNHPNIAMCYNNLGNVYNKMCMFDKAIEEYQKALGIYLVVYFSSPNHPNIAMCYHNLGTVYRDMGDIDRAIEEHQKAYTIYLMAYNGFSYHPYIALSYNNLGVDFESRGEFGKAIEEYQKALEIYLAAYKSLPYHPNIAMCHDNLGKAYRSIGQHDKALEEHEKALEMKLQIYSASPNHRNIAATHNYLGEVYCDLGEYAEAIQEHQEALQLCLRFYKRLPYHPNIAECHDNLGIAYRSMGQYDNALEEHKKALSIHLAVYKSSPYHPNIANCYNNLGIAHRLIGQHDKAIEEHKKALDVYLVVYEHLPYHQCIANSYNSLGNAYRNSGDYEQAIKYHNIAIRMFEVQKDRVSNKYLASCLNSMSVTYSSKGEYDEAIEYSKKALDIYNLCLNNEYINIARGNYEFNVKQLSIELFLKEEFTESNSYLSMLDARYSSIDINSLEFLSLLLKQVSNAYKRKLIKAAITSQEAILKVDPELNYGNHYHNLACFYSADGEIEEAMTNFKKALLHKEIKSDLHVEYAQFLIMHKEKIIKELSKHADETHGIDGGIDSSIRFSSASIVQEIKDHLYYVVGKTSDATDNDDSSGLSYGLLEKYVVCPTLQDIIIQKQGSITVTPKILAYYLLIRYPEYREEEEDIEKLLASFVSMCRELQDEVSFRLLSDAYVAVGDEELGAQYLKESELVAKIEQLSSTQLSKKELASEVGEDLEAILGIVSKLKELALDNLKAQKLEEASGIYFKIFIIYQKLTLGEILELTEENQSHYKDAANNLITLVLITHNVGLFHQLKGMGAEINPELVVAAGVDTEQILKFEQEITRQLAAQFQAQQTQAVESLNPAQQESEAVKNIGETGEDLSEI